MLNENAERFLENISKALSENVKEMVITGDEDSRSLSFSVDSPFEEGKELGYDITISEADRGFILVEFLAALFANIPEERFENINRIILSLNVPLTLGSFILNEETNAVGLTAGVIYDPATEIADVALNILKTVDLVEDAVLLYGAYIDAYLKGNMTVDEVIAEAENYGGDSQ